MSFSATTGPILTIQDFSERIFIALEDCAIALTPHTSFLKVICSLQKASKLEPALQSWAAPLVALPKIDPKISGLQPVFESICRPKSVFFDDFGPTNRGRVCQPSGNTAGDTQTSSNNRRSALMAESSTIIGRNRPKSIISGSPKSVSVTKCLALSRHHARGARSI